MRLIDADELKKLRKVEIDDYADGWTFAELWRAEEADIDSLPTIDAVGVVRCRDCEYFHRRQTMFGKEYTECDLYCAMQPAEEDYCSRGRLRNVQNVQ